MRNILSCARAFDGLCLRQLERTCSSEFGISGGAKMSSRQSEERVYGFGFIAAVLFWGVFVLTTTESDQMCLSVF